MADAPRKRGRPRKEVTETAAPKVKVAAKALNGNANNRNPKIAEYGKATQFQKGQSANPGGKPVGARNKLQGDFMRALADDFAEHGVSAIVETRETQPAQYIKIVASLMPKELELKRPMEDLTDDDIIAGIAALQRLVAASGDAAGAEGASGSKQTADIQGLH